MKKKLCTVWLLLFGSLVMMARPGVGAKMDSLTTMIDTTTKVSDKVYLLNKLASVQRNVNLLEAIKTTQKAEALAEEAEMEDWVIKMRDKQAFYYFLYKDFRESMSIGEELIAYYLEKGNLNRATIIQNRHGKISSELGDYDNALATFKKSEQVLLTINTPKTLGMNYLWVSDIWIIKGNYIKALEFAEKAIAQFEESGDYQFISAGMVSVGHVNLLVGEFEVARQYFESVLARRNELSNPMFLVRPLIFLGHVALEEGCIDEARSLLEEGIQWIKKIVGNSSDLPTALFLLAQVELLEGKQEAAVKLINKGIESAKEHGNLVREQHKGVLLLASIYAQKGDLNPFFEKLKHSFAWAEKSNELDIKYQSASLMAEYYAIHRQFDLAYQNQKLAESTKQALVKEQKMREVSVRNVVKEFERQVKEKEKQALTYQLEIEQRRNNVNNLGALASIAMVMVIFLSIILYLRQQNILQLQQSNRELKAAEKQIDLKNKELQRYIDTNLQLENFAYLASHDLRSPLQTIINFSNLLQKSIHDKLSDKEQTYIKFIINGSKNMQETISGLFRFAQASNTKLKITEFSPATKVNELLGDLQHTLSKKSATVDLQDMPKRIQADPELFKQLLQNLILNGVKFNRADHPPKLSLSAHEDNHQWTFSVADNGIGIDEKYLGKIFLLFKRLHNKSVYEGTGVGLATCKKIADLHGGEIWAESTLGKGSTFYFTIAKNAKLALAQ